MLRVLWGSRGFLSDGTSAAILLDKVTLRVQVRHGSSLVVALQNPKGFGPPPSKTSIPKSLSAEQIRKKPTNKQEKEGGPNEDDDDDEVPQIVTDRMLKRIGVSIGVPIVLGVLSFVGFYVLKVKLKVDIPEWLPLLVSGLFFGSAAFGITYGILSTSWDPVRDGSFWGWKEAQANWPVFFQSLKSKDERR